MDEGAEPDEGKSDPREARQLLTAIRTGRSRSSSLNPPVSRTSLVLADIGDGVLSGLPAAAQSVTTGVDSPRLSEASLQQLLEVLQERVRTQVNANAAQIPQLIA